MKNFSRTGFSLSQFSSTDKPKNRQAEACPTLIPENSSRFSLRQTWQQKGATR